MNEPRALDMILRLFPCMRLFLRRRKHERQGLTRDLCLSLSLNLCLRAIGIGVRGLIGAARRPGLADHRG